MRTGILGGTFDPVHKGHLRLAEYAYREYCLDRVLFMPAGVPYFKTGARNITPAKERLEMTRLAVKDIPYFSASDFELHLTGNTYTSETVARLKELYTEDKFYFIIGADSLYQLEAWHTPEKLLKNAVILCAGREYDGAERSLDDEILYLKNKYKAVNADIRRIHCKETDISSSYIRDLIKNGAGISEYVPKAVEEYIRENCLYMS